MSLFFAAAGFVLSVRSALQIDDPNREASAGYFMLFAALYWIASVGIGAIGWSLME